jgi:hypothetical protein
MTISKPLATYRWVTFHPCNEGEFAMVQSVVHPKLGFKRLVQTSVVLNKREVDSVCVEFETMNTRYVRYDEEPLNALREVPEEQLMAA